MSRFSRSIHGDAIREIAMHCDDPEAAHKALGALNLVGGFAPDTRFPALWSTVWSKPDRAGEWHAEALGSAACPDGLCRPEAAILLVLDDDPLPTGIAVPGVTVRSTPATLATKSDVERALNRAVETSVLAITDFAPASVPAARVSEWDVPHAIQRRVAGMTERQVRVRDTSVPGPGHELSYDGEILQRMHDNAVAARAAELRDRLDPQSVWMTAVEDSVDFRIGSASDQGIGL